MLDKPKEEIEKIDKDTTRKTIKNYDKNDNLSEIIYEDWSKTLFEYNFANNITKKTLLENNWNEIVTKYEYDKNWNLIKQIDAKWNKTNFEYDLFDRLIKQIDANWAYRVLNYDKLSNITSILSYSRDNLLMKKTSFSYDENWDVLKVVKSDLENGKDRIENYTYDLNQNLTKKIDANGNETNMIYDEFDRLIEVKDALWNKINLSYDNNSNVLKKSIIWNNEKNISTYYTYDKDNRLIQEKNQIGNSKKYIYNKLNQIISIIDENWNKKDYEYNYLWNIKKEISYLSWETIENIYEYDKYENITWITDWNWNKTNYIYDSLSRLVKEIYPDNNEVNYTYDDNFNIIKKTDQNGNTITNSYDKLDRLIERNITNPNKIVWTIKEIYTYDDLWRLIWWKSIDTEWKVADISFSFNSLDDLVSETNNSKEVKYDYDLNWNNTKIIYPTWKIIDRTYDEINRLTKLELDKKLVNNYDFKWLELVKETRWNNLISDYKFDELWRIENLKNMLFTDKKWKNIKVNVINDYLYTYDKVWNILQTWETNYKYDEVYRLINSNSETQKWNSNNIIENNSNYTYDKAGNRITRITENGKKWITENYKVNNLNQYINWEIQKDNNINNDDNGNNSNNWKNKKEKICNPNANENCSKNADKRNEKTSPLDKGGEWQKGTRGNWKQETINLEYDANGNITKDENYEYEYDYKNRLINVIKHNDKTKVSYTYDVLWRRLEKDFKWLWTEDKQKIVFVYSRNNVIEENIHDNWNENHRKEHIYSDRLDDIILTVIKYWNNDKKYYYTKDYLWSVTSISDDKKKVIEEYKYDEYWNGYVKSDNSPTWRELKHAKLNNTRLYTWREYEEETWLYYYRARYYKPELWRFISRDPIWQYDDVNLYAYVWNNPVNYVDPWGLEKSFIKNHDATQLLLKDMETWKNENLVTLLMNVQWEWLYNTKYRNDYKELSFNPETNKSCKENYSSKCVVYIEWKKKLTLSEIWNFLIWYNFYYAWFTLNNQYWTFYNDIYQAGLFTEDVLKRRNFTQNYEVFNDAVRNEELDRPLYDAWYKYAKDESNWNSPSSISKYLDFKD